MIFSPLLCCLCESLQAEEEALMLQQYVASEDTQQFERRVRPYVTQVLMVIFTLCLRYIIHRYHSSRVNHHFIPSICECRTI